jgi:predicted nucleic acid-binding Zn finger protein
VTAVDDWQDALDERGELDAATTQRLLRVHGSRAGRAIEAVAEERVKQYNDFTVVVGHREEYVVEGRGCGCEDARYNLDPEDPTDLCWHVIAAEIAERIGAVDYHDMWYSEVREFL